MLKAGSWPALPPTAPNHATMLTKAEKRLVAEWMDLGGQYFNDPFDAASGVRTVTARRARPPSSPRSSRSRGHLRRACHQAIGSDAVTATGASFPREPLRAHRQRRRRLGLDAVDDLRHLPPPQNLVLSKPSTIPHLAAALASWRRVLPAGSPGYVTISSWIGTGCPAHDLQKTTASPRGRRRPLAGCGGGSALGNAPNIENPAQTGGRKLSFEYFSAASTPSWRAG